MGRDTLIDWQLGTQAGFDAAAPLGTRNDEPICRRPGVAPLSDWSRNVAPHGQRTRVDDGHSEAARFARLNNTDKLGVALRTTAGAVGPEMGGKLRELISPTNLAIMAGALAIWVGAHATPIGWVVDIGMVGLGVVALGAEAVSVMRELHAFAMGVIKAKSEADLMAAGRHLAKAIAIVGVDVVVAILLKKAIVKVREPGAAAGEVAGGKKLFGKYDPKDAVRSLSAKPAVSDTNSAESVANIRYSNALFNMEARQTQAASDELVNAVRSRRDVYVAKPGSDDYKFLEMTGADASAGGPGNRAILIKNENPQRLTLMEEFLHGTQSKRWGDPSLDVDGTETAFREWHVRDFMNRHGKMLGWNAEEKAMLQSELQYWAQKAGKVAE